MKSIATVLIIMITLIVGMAPSPASAEEYKITGFYRATITVPTDVEFPYEIGYCQVNVTDGTSLEFTLATAATADSTSGVLKYPDELSPCKVLEALLGIPFDNGRLGNVKWIRMIPVGGPVTVKIPYSRSE